MNSGRHCANIINFNNIKVHEGSASSNETIMINVILKRSFKEKHKTLILKNIKKCDKELKGIERITYLCLVPISFCYYFSERLLLLL